MVVVNAKNEKQLSCAEEIYSELRKTGADVLLDDRKERAGVKFKDCDLIGYPLRITVGPKALEEGIIEVKVRRTGEVFSLEKDNWLTRVQEILKNL